MLLKELHSSSVSCIVLGLLVSIFSGNKISVDHEGKSSVQWLTKRSLRQGGVIFAYLFSFYINSIQRVVSDIPQGCNLGTNKLKIQSYADDVVVFCLYANRLSRFKIGSLIP